MYTERYYLNASYSIPALINFQVSFTSTDHTLLGLQIKRPLSSVIFDASPGGRACRANALLNANVTVILMRSMFQLFSMLKDGRKSCHARWGHVLGITYPQAKPGIISLSAHMTTTIVVLLPLVNRPPIPTSRPFPVFVSRPQRRI